MGVTVVVNKNLLSVIIWHVFSFVYINTLLGIATRDYSVLINWFSLFPAAILLPVVLIGATYLSVQTVSKNPKKSVSDFYALVFVLGLYLAITILPAFESCGGLGCIVNGLAVLFHALGWYVVIAIIPPIFFALRLKRISVAHKIALPVVLGIASAICILFPYW